MWLEKALDSLIQEAGLSPVPLNTSFCDFINSSTKYSQQNSERSYSLNDQSLVRTASEAFNFSKGIYILFLLSSFGKGRRLESLPQQDVGCQYNPKKILDLE